MVGSGSCLRTPQTATSPTEAMPQTPTLACATPIGRDKHRPAQSRGGFTLPLPPLVRGPIVVFPVSCAHGAGDSQKLMALAPTTPRKTQRCNNRRRPALLLARRAPVHSFRTTPTRPPAPARLAAQRCRWMTFIEQHLLSFATSVSSARTLVFGNGRRVGVWAAPKPFPAEMRSRQPLTSCCPLRFGTPLCGRS